LVCEKKEGKNMKMKNLLESLCFGYFFEYLNSGFPFLELERRGEEHLGFKKWVFVIVFNEFVFFFFLAIHLWDCISKC
jgi:hypothetical protein